MDIVTHHQVLPAVGRAKISGDIKETEFEIPRPVCRPEPLKDWAQDAG